MTYAIFNRKTGNLIDIAVGLGGASAVMDQLGWKKNIGFQKMSEWLSG